MDLCTFPLDRTEALMKAGWRSDEMIPSTMEPFKKLHFQAIKQGSGLGSEISGVASLRAIWQGHGVFAIAVATDIARAAESKNMEDIKAWWWDRTASDMKQQVDRSYVSHVQAGDVVYVPVGFLSLEQINCPLMLLSRVLTDKIQLGGHTRLEVPLQEHKSSGTDIGTPRRT